MRCSSIVQIACWLAMGAMILGGGADGTPRPTNDSAARANGKANTGTVRAVTGDSAQINTVVAGTPPSATISIVPVPAKVGSYPAGTTIVGNELRAPAGGFRAWFEFRLFGWDPNQDNIPPASGFQATIDATGYMDSDAPGDQPDLAPPVIPCTNDAAGNTLCRTAFGESFTRCELGTCKAAYVDKAGTVRTDGWCAGGGCDFADCDISTPDFRCVAIYPSPVRSDDGTQRYGGTLVLDIPPGAEGKYTVNLNTDETFMWDAASPPNDLPTFSETGFVVNIVPPPPGNIVWDANDLSTDRTTRSLRFRVEGKTDPLLEDAIRVTMVDLQNPQPPNAGCCPPQDFHTYEFATCTGDPPVGGGGCARWVGKPGTFLESQDLPALGNYRAARLQCTPFYFDWVTETATTPITVVGAEILPSSEYSVKTYGSSCDGTEATCTDVGTAVTMKTRRSADVALVYNPPGTTTQPDALDVTVLVNKFKFVPGSPSKALLQLQPNLPELNGDINALDIVAVVEGVKGFAYSFGGPCPCPSLVICGATPCPGVATCTGSGLPGLGAESMCVKMCSVSGAPCIDATACPTGETCGSPSCRDACGRCTP